MEKQFNPEISIFKNLYDSKNSIVRKLSDVLNDIKTGKESKELINKIRDAKDVNSESVTKLKNNLQPIMFNGTFSSRGVTGLIKHSGICVLDFDGYATEKEMLIEKEAFTNDEYTLSVFISPRGKGLKVLIKIPQSTHEEHGLRFDAFKEYINSSNFDNSSRDVSRICFGTYDKNIFINYESKVFKNIHEKEKKEVKKKVPNDFEEQEIKTWDDYNNKNDVWALIQGEFIDKGTKNNCRMILRNDSSAKTSGKIFNDTGRLYLHTDNTIYPQSVALTPFDVYKYKHHNGNIIAAIKEAYSNNYGSRFKRKNELVKNNKNNNEFWYTTNKGVLKIENFRLKRFIENFNISKYYPSEESDSFVFIEKNGNFINETAESKIKDYVLNHLENNNNFDVWNLITSRPSYFSKDFLSMIGTSNIEVSKDSKNESILYYKNIVVRISKNSIEEVSYDKLNCLVWKNQVIDRNVVLDNESDGEFKTFIWRISGQDKERYYTLKSVIGYLMHSYQNDAKPKAIIFNDEMISDDIPNGGSGKGLIHKAIGKIKNLVSEDGKKWDSKSQFAYQKVDNDTQVFLMDDVSKNFNFESLFSIITEGMTIEKKGKDSYQIPFNESPKISITTNYTIKGSGASFLRRVFEVEIANHYNENNSPEDEFGHQFFSDWDKFEWAKFDNFMIRCVQFYLKNGLVESNKVNLEFRKLKNNLGAEFIEFMESQSFDGSRLNKKDFRDEFNKQYPTIARFNTAQKFNKKVKDYCDFNSISFKEVKANGIIHFEIGNEENNNNDILPY